MRFVFDRALHAVSTTWILHVLMRCFPSEE